MFYRPSTHVQLKDLADEVPSSGSTSLIEVREMEVDLTSANRSIRWQTGEGGSHETPVSAEGLQYISSELNVPWKFIERQDDEFRQEILSGLIARQAPGLRCVRHNDEGILGFHGVDSQIIPAERLISTALTVMPETSDVTDFRYDADEFVFSAVVPEGWGEGWGGDPDVEVVSFDGESRVGDLTAGGLRFGYSADKGHAPWVQPYQYRLICTNGMETADRGLRMDARGMDVGEMIEHLESLAERAFARVEADIASFYGLREERVSNPERTILRLADEHGLSDRVATDLARRSAAIESPSTFDLVNLITNEANNPANKHGKTRSLQQVGGAIVSDHVDRCGACQSRLGH